jgi:hypothetical protein
LGPTVLVTTVGLVLAAVTFTGGDAAAANVATVSVTPSSVASDHPSTITLSGSGFQSIPNGFGGIYVLFGTASGNWRPSQGGINGTNYNYVPDSQTTSNAGYQKFVSFPGGATAAEANGGLIAADGSWHTTLLVPGATFTSTSGAAINCRQVQCGVITIGAHGVINGANETFTPMAFAAAPTAAAPPPAPATSVVVKPTTVRPTAAKANSAAPSAAPAQNSANSASSPAAGSAPVAAVASSTTPTEGGVDGLVISNPTSSSGQPALRPAAATSKSHTNPGWWIALLTGAVLLAAAIITFLLRRHSRIGRTT